MERSALAAQNEEYSWECAARDRDALLIPSSPLAGLSDCFVSEPPLLARQTSYCLEERSDQRLLPWRLRWRASRLRNSYYYDHLGLEWYRNALRRDVVDATLMPDYRGEWTLMSSRRWEECHPTHYLAIKGARDLVATVIARATQILPFVAYRLNRQDLTGIPNHELVRLLSSDFQTYLINRAWGHHISADLAAPFDRHGPAGTEPDDTPKWERTRLIPAEEVARPVQQVLDQIIVATLKPYFEQAARNIDKRLRAADEERKKRRIARAATPALRRTVGTPRLTVALSRSHEEAALCPYCNRVHAVGLCPNVARHLDCPSTGFWINKATGLCSACGQSRRRRASVPHAPNARPELMRSTQWTNGECITVGSSDARPYWQERGWRQIAPGTFAGQYLAAGITAYGEAERRSSSSFEFFVCPPLPAPLIGHACFHPQPDGRALVHFHAGERPPNLDVGVASVERAIANGRRR